MVVVTGGAWCCVLQGRLVRQRYLTLRNSAVDVQRFARSRLARRFFLRARAAVIPIQSMVRGHLARRLVGNFKAMRMAVDEGWHLQCAKAREVATMVRDAVEVHSESFWQHAPVLVGKGSSAQSLASGSRHMLMSRPMYRVADVDFVTNASDVYGDGWASALSTLQRSLHKDSRHLVSFAVGDSHSAALASDGEVYTWGWSDRGQLGHGDRANRDRPTPLGLLEEASMQKGLSWSTRVVMKSVCAGADHTIALSNDGRAFSWGANSRGQLGLGHREFVTAPKHIAAIKRKIVQVACGSIHRYVVASRRWHVSRHVWSPIRALTRGVCARVCVCSVLLTVAGSVYVCGAGQYLGFPVVPGEDTLSAVVPGQQLAARVRRHTPHTLP